MSRRSTSYRVFGLLAMALLVTFVANLWLGSVHIPVEDIIKALTGLGDIKQSWHYIIINYRLPKALTAMMAGSGLAAAGLMMQTLFKNPLAGPFVLGISSGASLGVAIFILGGSLLGIASGGLAGSWGLIIAASAGSFLVLAIVISVAGRVRDAMALLIIGLMFGSLTAAVVSILSYFSPAAQLQRYIFWSFGSLGDLSWEGVGILATCYTLGILLAISILKQLNSLLLGDLYAQTLGMTLKKSRLIIIIATSILAGSITAFAGPIAFVGLAVPHLIRQCFDTANHWTLMPASLLGGAILMLVCDSISQAPFQSYTLPINAITSLVGAPIVIWLLVRRKKLVF